MPVSVDDPLYRFHIFVKIVFSQVVHELETHAQWCFDVQWCPRNPNVISTGSFDGHITIHSLMGGEVPLEQETADDKQRNVVCLFFCSSIWCGV